MSSNLEHVTHCLFMPLTFQVVKVLLLLWLGDEMTTLNRSRVGTEFDQFFERHGVFTFRFVWRWYVGGSIQRHINV